MTLNLNMFIKTLTSYLDAHTKLSSTIDKIISLVEVYKYLNDNFETLRDNIHNPEVLDGFILVMYNKTFETEKKLKTFDINTFTPDEQKNITCLREQENIARQYFMPIILQMQIRDNDKFNIDLTNAINNMRQYITVRNKPTQKLRRSSRNVKKIDYTNM
jgi:hypothetical protein